MDAVSPRIRRVTIAYLSTRRPGRADQQLAGRQAKQSAASHPIAANAVLAVAAGTSGLRALLAHDSLVGFLVLLVLVLALALFAIIRLSPQEARSIELDSQRDTAYARPVPPVSPRPAPMADAAPALLPRPVVQSGQRGYAARHGPGPGPGPGPGTDTALRPRVTGGPPWGPAPRPPDLRS